MKLRVFLAAAMALLGTLAISGIVPGTVSRAGAANPVIVTTQQSSYGSVLFTGDGRALYMLTNDTVGTSTTPAQSSCTGPCAGAWPPLLTDSANGGVQAAGDVKASGLGTIQRADGTFQVTYFGRPLYMFVNDKAAGQTNGEKVAAFNGMWYLLSANGRPNPGVATVNTESTTNGTALSATTAFNGFRSLYLLTTDPANSSTCSGGCARFWPPLLTSGPPVAGSGVNAAGLGTIHRADGTTQVTYFGTPLYFYTVDLAAGAKSGLTNGEDNVDPFNQGTWYTVAPSGAALPGQATIGSKSTDLGTVLTYNGMAAYAFSADHGASACTGLCARVWTPVLTTGAPQADSSSSASATGLGTVQRPDGTTQVTYHGQPLYLFSKDYTGTGGQGLATFGGHFQLMQTSGAVSTAMPSTRPTLAVPQLDTTGPGVSASFTVAFTSTAPGQGMVLFGTGPGCTGLVEVGTQDTSAGTTTHMVTVTGNDMPGTVGDAGIQPGTVYSYEVLTLSPSGVQTDDNKGKCYTISVPQK